VTTPTLTIAQQVAEVVKTYQEETTGHSPTSVTAVLSENTLVVTLQQAFAPAETALALNSDGATLLQEFHRQLFATSSESLKKEIGRITGRQVCEAAVEVEPSSGSVVHAFTTGTLVQVFLLAPEC
jgi:uncharacterized protein YbcI